MDRGTKGSKVSGNSSDSDSDSDINDRRKPEQVIKSPQQKSVASVSATTSVNHGFRPIVSPSGAPVPPLKFVSKFQAANKGNVKRSDSSSSSEYSDIDDGRKNKPKSGLPSRPKNAAPTVSSIPSSATTVSSLHQVPPQAKPSAPVKKFMSKFQIANNISMPSKVARSDSGSSSDYSDVEDSGRNKKKKIQTPSSNTSSPMKSPTSSTKPVPPSQPHASVKTPPPVIHASSLRNQNIDQKIYHSSDDSDDEHEVYEVGYESARNTNEKRTSLSTTSEEESEMAKKQRLTQSSKNLLADAQKQSQISKPDLVVPAAVPIAPAPPVKVIARPGKAPEHVPAQQQYWDDDNSSFSSVGGFGDEDDDDGAVGDWLEEIDEEPPKSYDFEEEDKKKAGAVEDTPLDPFIMEYKALYDAIICISDLRFTSLSTEHQAELLATLIEESYEPGEVIFEKDSEAGDLYFITGPQDAQVEVIKIVDNTPKLLTRLGFGQYFGQKAFISNRITRRNTTVKALTKVNVAVLTPEYFSKWSHFRTFLLMKEVPMFRTLPHEEQLHMFGQLQHQDFVDGEYIVRQGDVGDKFYMITEGAVDVVEERILENGAKTNEVLTRLYEGHFFGEMALIYDEPRVASVIAVGRTSCLYLTTQAFREALSAQQFHIMMQEISYKRVLMREQRKITREMTEAKRAEMGQEEDDPDSRMDSDSESFTKRSQSMDDTNYSDTSSDSQKVTTTNKLVRSRLSTGDRLINKYLVLKEIGRGTSGDVYLCKNEENGQLAAMKIINRPTNRWSQTTASEIEKEINIMKSLRHPNIVSLLEVIDDPSVKQVFLVQEYMQGGPILPGDIVTEPVPAEQARGYFRDMLKGLKYLHSQGIVHRDIKPQNMLRTAEDVVKIADFGAAVFTNGATEVVAAGGTPAFMAPEMFLVGTPGQDKDVVNSPKVDVWSLGVTLFNLIAGRPPFLASNQLELAAKIQNIELSYPEELLPLVDPHLRHLISRMLDKDPKTRYDLDQVIEHDWVTSEGSHPLEDPLAQMRDTDLFFSPPFELRVGLGGREGTLGHATLGVEEDMSAVSEESRRRRGSGVGSEIRMSERSISRRGSIEFGGFDGAVKASPTLKHGSKLLTHRVSSLEKSEMEKLLNNREILLIPVGTGNVATSTDAAKTAPSQDRESDTESNYSPSAPSLDGSGTGPRTLHRTTDFVMMPSEVVLAPTGEKIKKTVIFTAPKLERQASANAQDLEQQRMVKTANARFRPSSSFNMKPKTKRGSSASGSFRSSSGNVLDETASSMRSLGTMSETSRSVRSTRSLLRSVQETSNAGGLNISQSLDDFDVVEEAGEDDAEVITVRRPATAPKSLRVRQSFGSDSVTSSAGVGSVSEDGEYEGEVVLVTTHESDGELGGVGVGGSDSDDGSDAIDLDLAGAETLDDLGMANVLDDLCATPIEKYKGADPHLLPLTLDTPQELQTLKTWAGQWNLALGIRFGVAESIVDREYMEDRTWTVASYTEFSKRRKSHSFPRQDSLTGQDSTSSLTLLIAPDSTSEPVFAPEPSAPAIAPDFAFFGIFDGHNGHYVAEALQSSLYQLFKDRWEEAADDMSFENADISITTRAIKCIVAACAQLDRAILGHDFEKQRLLQQERRENSDHANNKASHIKETFSFAGSTAVVMIVLREYVPPPSASGNPSERAWDSAFGKTQGPVKLVLANVGDCRAVLSDGGTAVNLTTPHKPSLSSEKARIENAGGWVHRDRVNGVLAVSRSFGDIMYKTFPPPNGCNPSMPAITSPSPGTSPRSSQGSDYDLLMHLRMREPQTLLIPWDEGGGLWGPEQQVVSRPETIEVEVLPSHEFVVMASDGVWDVLTPEEVVNFVRRRLAEHGDCQRAAIETVSKAEARGTSDNTSVVICCLNQIERSSDASRRPSGEFRSPYRLHSQLAAAAAASLASGSPVMASVKQGAPQTAPRPFPVFGSPPKYPKVKVAPEITLQDAVKQLERLDSVDSYDADDFFDDI